MCGIIGAASSRSVGKILIKGLQLMEYRGYDSAGVVLNKDEEILRLRSLGKVSKLEDLMISKKPRALSGIAHTRWATHGAPSEENAHPHGSHNDIFIVHNGIIENHEEIREFLRKEKYEITSETDSELIAHLVHFYKKDTKDTLKALMRATKELKGAYSIAVVSEKEKGKVYAARQKSPLLVGIGIEENFIASDPLAIVNITEKFYMLEDGDFATVTKEDVAIYDNSGAKVERDELKIDATATATSKGDYKHFMEKEIYEQPECIGNTINGRLGENDVLDNVFGLGSSEAFKEVKRVQFVACGTSLHAAKTARKWFEDICEIPCYVDFASEYRYRNPIVENNTLFVTISQSGETADTLAALNYAKDEKYVGIVSICNVPTSTMARESDWKVFTNAGPEIGVATPISGPALVKTFQSDSLAIVLVGTLHMETMPTYFSSFA